MKRVYLSGLLAIALAGNARADDAAATRAEIQKQLGFVPELVKAMPDAMLPGAWRQLTTLQMNPNTALPGKVKELIGLAVASQVPCTYCVYGHTEFAKLDGASDVEIGEAIGLAGLTRHWSTILNGAQIDPAKYRADINRIAEAAKQAKPGATPPAPMVLTDAASAMKEIEQRFGFVPELFKPVPPDELPGAWQAMRDLEMSPTTALPGKYKSLIGLAVASQIPCAYCVVGDTIFAKLAGASDAEVHEAVAMAALVRQFSTLLNGRQVDFAAYKRDIRRLVAQAKQPHQHAAR
jgi:AhpD family alkylhydroperoxidase